MDEIPTPSLTVENLLKFALNKYTDQFQIDNHVWRSSSKRKAEFVALAAEVTTLKGNMKISDKISKDQKPNRGKGDESPKYRTGDKRKSKKEKAARLVLWQIDCIALKKVPPTPGGPSTKNFTKEEYPGFSTKKKRLHWCKHHIIWCMYTSDQFKVVNK